MLLNQLPLHKRKRNNSLFLVLVIVGDKRCKILSLSRWSPEACVLSKALAACFRFFELAQLFDTFSIQEQQTLSIDDVLVANFQNVMIYYNTIVNATRMIKWLYLLFCHHKLLR